MIRTPLERRLDRALQLAHHRRRRHDPTQPVLRRLAEVRVLGEETSI
jgi:hypothetical protein